MMLRIDECSNEDLGLKRLVLWLELNKLNSPILVLWMEGALLLALLGGGLILRSGLSTGTGQ